MRKLLARMRIFFYKLGVWLGLIVPDPVWYIGGSETLPPPLSTEEEVYLLERFYSDGKAVRRVLIERNLRLVVYIARKFENTGINIEDLISIGTIGLIKAINTFRPEKNIKLATYASRCIENEILMFLRKNSSRRNELSIDEPLNVDWARLRRRGRQTAFEIGCRQIVGTGTDDYLHALRPRRTQGDDAERSGGYARNFTVLYIQARKTHYCAVKKRNIERDVRQIPV